MKTTAFSFLLCLFGISLLAQVPPKMSYQAVVRDAAGNLVTNKQITMRITILQGTLPGSMVYQEMQSPVTNANGLVTVEIGGDIRFEIINWGSGDHYIKTEIDPTGGLNYTIIATSQLLSVPYAQYAKTAGTSPPWIPFGSNIYYNNGNVGIGTENPEAKLDVNGVVDVNNNNITNVANPVNEKDAVNKTYVEVQITKLQNSIIAGGFVEDIDGNRYNTVKIGSQIWMTENLKTTKYNDGTAIPLVTDNAAWVNLTTPGYCWYNNDYTTYGAVYGALYNWYAVKTGALCPEGWHVPLEEEWTTLTTFLGGESVAGGMMKETGTAHWISPNTGATNESGFTGLPGGYRSHGGGFYSIGVYGNWWSPGDHSAYLAFYLYLSPSTNVHWSVDNKESGFSVRCLRD